MENRLLKLFGYWAMGLLLVVATLLIVHWTRNSVPWSKLDSGWAQAIGGVAAIWAAYHFGERQAQVALQTVHEADKVAAKRKFDSVLAVADSASNYAKQISKAFSGQKASFLHLEILYSKNFMEDVINALQVVPAHELGSYDSVTAMLALRNAMNDLRGNIERAIHKFESEAEGCSFPHWIEFDKAPIDLCLSKIEQCVKSLHEERDSIC